MLFPLQRFLYFSHVFYVRCTEMNRKAPTTGREIVQGLVNWYSFLNVFFSFCFIFEVSVRTDYLAWVFHFSTFNLSVQILLFFIILWIFLSYLGFIAPFTLREAQSSLGLDHSYCLTSNPVFEIYLFYLALSSKSSTYLHANFLHFSFSLSFSNSPN